MRAVLRIALWPVALIALVMHDCYEVFWYCVIIGRPAWIRDHKNPVQDLAAMFRSTKQ